MTLFAPWLASWLAHRRTWRSITPSAAVGTGLGNYTITYHNAAIGLTVNKAHLTVTAVDKSKTYDAAPFTAVGSVLCHDSVT